MGRWRRKWWGRWRRNHAAAAAAVATIVVVIIVVIVVVVDGAISRVADCATAAGGSSRCHRCRIAKASMFGQRRNGAEWLAAALAADLQSAIGVHALVTAQVRKLGVCFQADFALKRLEKCKNTFPPLALDQRQRTFENIESST